MLKIQSKLYEKVANLGGAKIQLQLGQMHKNGNGVCEDYQEALFWFRKSAEQNLPEAQYEIGMMYHEGIGVLQDYLEALYWLEKASVQGHTEAQYEIGMIYLNGTGVLQNHRKAFYWFEKAAHQGHAKAQFKIYKKAAHQGDIKAQCQLGYMYMHGKGVLRDEHKAVDWYQRAAEQGNLEAQLWLGQTYKNGNGFLKDDQKAFYWFEKVVSQDNWFTRYDINEIDDSYINRISDSLKEPTPLPKTLEIEEEFCFSLLEEVEQFLSYQSERDRNIFIRRLGLKTPPQTLQSISDSDNMTRDRVSRIENRLIKKWQLNSCWADFMKEVKELLNEKNSPLSLAGAETVNPKYRGLSNHSQFFGNLINATDSNINILKVNNISYFCTINESVWDAAVKEAKIFLSEVANKGFSEAEVRLLIQGFLPEGARQLESLLWDQASRLCGFSDINGISMLVSYGRGAESIIKTILAESDTPLHYKEVAEHALLKGKNLNIRTVFGALQNAGLLFSVGTYGHAKHIPLSDEQIFYICETAERIVCAESPAKQWHVSEILHKLSTQSSRTFPELNKYLLSIILAKSKILTSLGRRIWVVKKQTNHSPICLPFFISRLIKKVKQSNLTPTEFTFDYDKHGFQLTALKNIRSESGWLKLSKVTMDGFRIREELLCSAISDNGREFDKKQCQHLMILPTTGNELEISIQDKIMKLIEKKGFHVEDHRLIRRLRDKINKLKKDNPGKAPIYQCQPPARLDELEKERLDETLHDIAQENEYYFDEEYEKLDAWAADAKTDLEIEIKKLDKAIKEAKRQMYKLTLQERIKVIRVIKNLEKRRDKKHLDYNDTCNDVDKKMDNLLTEMEANMKSDYRLEEIFTIRWNLI